MTSTQRRAAQIQLDTLRKRKATAEAKGPEVIARNQALYDRICADIQRLEDELAVDDGGMAADLLQTLREIICWEWYPGALRLALSVLPQAQERLTAAEREIVAAYNLGDSARCRKALEEYRNLFKEFSAEACKADGKQYNINDFMEVPNAEQIFARS